MTATLTNTKLFDELDYRENEGIEVSLLWNRREDSLVVFVFDSRTDEAFEVLAAPHEARDVFTHPFAYATSRSTAAKPARSSDSRQT
jgi:hypothetical protein